MPAAADHALGIALADRASERAQAVSGSAPVLTEPAPMALDAGTTADQALFATDADGDPITFSKSFGPAYMTVTTVDPGSGSATGNVHLAPSLSDAGVVNGGIVASDGALLDARTLRITVNGPNSAPLLAQPADMSARAGQTVDQTLTATDPDQNPLTFSKISGPFYLSVQTIESGMGEAMGLARIAPTSLDSGTTTGTVAASDGLLSDQKSFGITVQANTTPTLQFISSMSVRVGSTQDQTIYAYDPDGDALTFSKDFGPSFMSVSTLSSSGGSAYGNIHLAPGLGDAGTYGASVSVSDGALSAQQSFTLYVNPANRAPVLTQPANMTVTLGEVAEQTVTATDPDGDYISIYKASGPAYVTVSSFGGSGFASATIRVAPGAGDAGTAMASITASDFYLTDTKSFTIVAQPGSFPPLCGASSFSALTTSFGYGTLEVQTADLNGDGVLDLVVELPNEGRVAVALGNGDGTFGQTTDLDPESSPVSGTIADLNRDGIPDLAIANIGSNNVSIFLGDGTGAFGPKRNFNVGSGPRAVAAVDVNRDSKMDLLVANEGSGSVSLLRGIGDGTFAAATTFPAGLYAFHLIAPDLNQDGAPDLVVANPGDNDISVFLNNGTGTFGQRTDYPVGVDALAVAAGDLNGDGKLDVAATSAGSNYVSVFLGVGNGTLNPKRNYATHGGPRQIAVADLNGDNQLDLGIANLDTDDVSILLGDGSGAIAPRTDVHSGSGPFGVAWGDFNDDLRNDLAIANYYGGSVTLLLNNGCAPARDHPPVVKGPKAVTGAEASAISFSVTANDPDGPAIASLTANVSGLPVGNNASFTPDPQNTGGVFLWTPTYQDSRPTPYPVVFTATNVLSGYWTTQITVSNVNRGPVANADGPYTAFAGTPLTLDGSGSSDPDGDALAFSWVFGDGTTGTGAKPSHTYAAIGLYGIALTVFDGSVSALATTTANIVGLFQARAFTTSGNRSIRLGSGKPQWCADIEPVGRSFAIVTVDITSIVMKSAGTGSVSEIRAIGDKVSVGGDHDGNGVEEVTACFRKDDLRLLFSSLRGSTPVTVTFEGALFTGGRFQAQMDVLVIAAGGSLAASVSPNPLNPEAVLTFRTEREGPARIELFDLGGRRVRCVLAESSLPAGYHDVRIDGRDEHGERLASGVYFFRITATEGEQSGRLTVLR